MVTTGKGTTSASPGRVGLRDPDARRQDRAHVGGAETTEGHGAFQRGDERVATMGRLETGELVEVGSERRHPSAGRRLDEGLGHRAQAAERLLGGRLGADRSAGCGPGPAVVVVVDRRLTRGNEGMVGHHRAEEDYLDAAVGDSDLDLAADVAGRDRIAGRAEPDAD